MLMAEAIRTTVVPITPLIRTTVVLITGIGYRHDGKMIFSNKLYTCALNYIDLSLNKLIMCLAIEIHSKLTFLLIMNMKTSLI